MYNAPVGQSNRETGSVYIFTTNDNGSTWTQAQKLTPSDVDGDYFGRTVV